MEQLLQTKQPTPLEALYTLVSGAIYGITRTTDEYLEYQHIIETALLKNVELELTSYMALMIIKKKRVDIRDLQECSNLEEYNENISMNWSDKKEAEYHNELLTQAEYDLLKEVLLYE